MLRLRFLLSICFFSILSIGILHSQWVQTPGLTGVNMRCLLVSDTTIFAGTDNSGVWRSTENDTNWTRIDIGLTSTFILSLTESGTNIFAGTNGGVFISTDKGDSWTGINDGLTDSYIYAIAAIGPTLFAATNDSGIFISTNNGASWTTVNIGLTTKSVTSLIASPNGVGGSNIFAGTYGGGIFLSTNNGASWTAANNGLTSEYVRKLALCPNGTGGSNIFAGTYFNGVFLSTDNSSSWTEVNTGLTDHSILSLTSVGHNILAGTSGSGVFLSTDNGASWTAVNTGLIDENIMAIAASGSYLFAGTFGAGVWKRPLSEMITPVSVSSGNFIKEFRLEQNYPNPFNPNTVISYQLSVISDVKLSIYDVLGREIEVLANNRQNAGTYTTRWNAQNFPSGIYFYRLVASAIPLGQANSFTQTKKLILLK